LPDSVYRRLGPLVPYGACFVVVWGMIGLESALRWREVIAALILQLVVGVALWWRDRWQQSQLVSLLGISLFLLSVALLRDGVGRVVGGYGTLVLLPVIWAALRNRRIELVLAVVGAAVVQLGPVLVVGGSYYPASGWRSGALLIVIAGVLGATVLALVERVRSSERLHRLLAENSSDLVIRGSRDGIIRYASPASVAMLGYLPADLVGKTIGELTHPEDQAGREERLRRIDAAEHTAERLARMRHQDGRWLWLEATVRPIRNSGGLVVERQYAFRDVTERVQRDDEQSALSRIATLAATGADPAAVFDAVAEELARLLDATAGAVVRFDLATRTGVPVGLWTRPGREARARSLDLDADNAAGRVFRTACTARLDEKRPSGPDTRDGRRPGGGAVSAPVTVSGELWGAVGASFEDAAVPDGLEQRLTRFADLVSLAISNAQTLQTLAQQATTDPITGLANHRSFHDRLGEEVERATRYKRSLTLAVIDIDHFKQVNDTYGHQIGDRVLADVASQLAAAARAGDVVGRIGGEEFAWLMPDTDAHGGAAAADRARRAISSLRPRDAGSITVSAGVCALAGGLDRQELMRCADQALYEAKEAGRDRVRVHETLPSPRVKERAA
jgi:diguanylate cyclase (GGDEF)-like protein/PAS domain S-box-containing protein